MSPGTELDNLVSKGNIKMYQGQLQFAVIPPAVGGNVKESIHLLNLAINPFYRSIVRC